ncbi:hypothetical protein DPEC_G00167600 [Dallia pectoralis]|uniref:Uncharacterized protein n=1 Tax=Dallia pectoralis TaxID=75939 RepID=A0ACC2GI71_DALPE|nr:hypothetical protein DPEC_G00167600 [Dallia pectoralis]
MPPAKPVYLPTLPCPKQPAASQWRYRASPYNLDLYFHRDTSFVTYETTVRQLSEHNWCPSPHYCRSFVWLRPSCAPLTNRDLIQYLILSKWESCHCWCQGHISNLAVIRT